MVGTDGISDDASDAENGVLAQSGTEPHPTPTVVVDELIHRNGYRSPADGVVKDADDVHRSFGKFLQDAVACLLDVAFQPGF